MSSPLITYRILKTSRELGTVQLQIDEEILDHLSRLSRHQFNATNGFVISWSNCDEVPDLTPNHLVVDPEMFWEFDNIEESTYNRLRDALTELDKTTHDLEPVHWDLPGDRIDVRPLIRSRFYPTQQIKEFKGVEVVLRDDLFEWLAQRRSFTSSTCTFKVAPLTSVESGMKYSWLFTGPREYLYDIAEGNTGQLISSLRLLKNTFLREQPQTEEDWKVV